MPHTFTGDEMRALASERQQYAEALRRLVDVHEATAAEAATLTQGRRTEEAEAWLQDMNATIATVRRLLDLLAGGAR